MEQKSRILQMSINFCRKYNLNFALTRFTNDIIDHNENLCLGVLGEKGKDIQSLFLMRLIMF